MSFILVVEDDRSLGANIEARLKSEGYEALWVKSKNEAMQVCLGEAYQQKRPDLVVLDIGLPDGSGLDLARDIRLSSNMAIVFLSAMNSAENRLEGFELGAEDFIPKPFHLKELLMRVKRIVEKDPSVKPTSRIEAISFALEPLSLEIVFSDGSKELLAKRDFELLRLLVSSSPKILSRDEILEKLWADDKYQTGRTIDNTIMRLRQVLRSKNVDNIKAVRGIGYQWLVG